MVCLGNICRSPLAEGILQDKVSKQNIPWIVDSAGTGAYHVGDMPDIRSIEVASQRGIDIRHQRARKIHSVDFEEFDLIFVMDAYNYQDLVKLATEEEKPKIKMILNELYPNENRSVPDPYYGGKDGFRNVFDMLDSACDCIISHYYQK